MKIKKAVVKNFRMLKDLEVDFQKGLSLIVGKNNSGKTSFLIILEKFLSDEHSKPSPFTFDDLNIDSQNKLVEMVVDQKKCLSSKEYQEIFLSLKIIMKYNLSDNIGNASKILLDLDTTNQYLEIEFKNQLEYQKYRELFQDFKKYNKNDDREEKNEREIFYTFLRKYFKNYFFTKIFALEYGNEKNWKEIDNKIVRSIISLQTISAKRDVKNEEGRGQSLSSLAEKYYDATFSENTMPSSLQKGLESADRELDKVYKETFEPMIQDVRAMSYNSAETEISVLSTLSEKNILQENTTVKYKLEDSYLPEDYNGLGYLNLIEMIFDIGIKLDKLAKKNNPDEDPTPINLLFIEEPEAHTHPQMQYVFINNIKEILEKRCKLCENLSLQTIISTHSSHIVSQCDFEDIRYFYCESETSVKARNLNQLQKSKNYTDNMSTNANSTKEEKQKRNYRFLKQYITLNRSELFFADKAILIEGDTERILLPTMMEKVDSMMKKIDSKNQDSIYTPLRSQNISIVEVGAYSHIFADFLGFIGIKTLIITDLDCANNNRRSCAYNDGAKITTNASIETFLKTNKLDEILEKSELKVFSYDSEKREWKSVKKDNGKLLLTFQKEENGYQPRTFEDAFFCLNFDFICNNKEVFKGLKNKEKIDENRSKNYYSLAENCIDKKTSFALDLLLCETDDEKNQWKVPRYIEEGLKWLAK